MSGTFSEGKRFLTPFLLWHLFFSAVFVLSDEARNTGTHFIPESGQDSVGGTPAGTNQLWTLTKIQVWSIYCDDGKTWNIHPSDKDPEVSYKGDFGPPNVPGDNDRVGFAKPKKGRLTALYYIRTDKTIGFGTGKKTELNVTLSKADYEAKKNAMKAGSEGAYYSIYFYVHHGNLKESRVALDKSMPKEVKESYDEIARIAKRNSKDIAADSGVYFYASLTTGKVKPFTFQALKE